ncbi:hypothetical protein PSQ19_05600 [Devosia algicola]|uniref:Uncharacterized protein n=1 Tax=Devosia algicola TaxID=3026418 RepID=A0ABY7YQG2_9HYPH|nr:hypothetical protein [Devosia algicola]WDR03563.1 hypothetical protein PSQ19_05600 [Devosia algicola]
MLRAISFVVRDTSWGTYAPVLDDWHVDASDLGFRISYSGQCTGPNGSFDFEARIEGSADGRLSFSAKGSSSAGFSTNRTGFVVLHGLEGVRGTMVDVRHSDGRRSRAKFPDLVDPDTPITNIRALTHSPRPGLSVTVTMRGEAFEMEDQRNWTDASYKTYVRPLALGYPYVIDPEVPVIQSIELQIADTADGASPASPITPSVSIRESTGSMPAVGLAWTGGDTAFPKGLCPSHIVARFDARMPLADLALDDLGKLLGETGATLDADIVIDGISPIAELARISAMIKAAGLGPARILVVPARDLRSRASRHLPEGEADYPEITAAARAAFPGVAIGGGTVVGFPETQP